MFISGTFTKILILLLFYFTGQNAQVDRLMLPLYGGKVLPPTSLERFHNITGGVTILAAHDSSIVRSCSSGTVHFTTSLSKGNIVIIQSEKNVFYCYSFLTNLNVKKGDLVKAGSNLGKTTASRELNFLVSKGEKYLDATNYLIFSTELK